MESLENEIIEMNKDINNGIESVKKAKKEKANTSSEPLPTNTFFSLTLKYFAIACFRSSAVGLGYNFKSSFICCLIASSTFGDGGYGFSFVFNLITEVDLGCSPGTYGSIRFVI